MACGEFWLTILVVGPLITHQIAIATYYLLRLRIPHYELLVAVLACVILVPVKFLACSASSHTEGYLAQTAYLTHQVGRVVIRKDVYLVVALVGHAQLLLWSEFRLYELKGYWCYDFCIHLSSGYYILLQFIY